MRLYDKMLTQAPLEVRENMRAKASETTVVTADVVAAHYCDSPEMHWGPEMYPHARPPWDTCWIEFRGPPTVRMEGKLIPQPKAESGVFCITRPMTAKLRQGFRTMRGESVLDLGQDRDLRMAKAVEAATVTVLAQPATFAMGRLIVPRAQGYWFLNDDGFVLDWIMSGDDEHFHQMVHHADAMGTSFGLEWFHIAWLTFTFCHCKNVKLVDATEELQPTPKIRRRLKLPHVRRYTLDIGGHVDRPRRDYEDAETGVMPFHLCRGHFATYTPDKPMFGNPKLVGRYWHPPHTKGKRENGEIVKDYAVAPSTQVTSA